ncbi:LPS export ABC transporter periplasmic protein LptC [Robertkochia flava]|uniref:LPS export ABC transporter periplasmic protein LptC n=1 Tax=Robertkochia flava TaxID=3447986 RepID=UPI001CCB1F11|nr:LPS export ABC transporter periplasmic protein LptC [Robertkochia marina]
MKAFFRYIFLNIVTVFTVTMFFSCKGDNLEEVRRMSEYRQVPVGEASNFELRYTDSLELRAIVKGKVYRDFTNQDFPYQEFPEGVRVDYFSETGDTSTVTANYGVIYSNTKLIDLQGDVNLITSDGKHLQSPQLYFDQVNNWIFTEKDFEFTSQDYDMTGTGIDFNKDFTQVRFRGKKGSAVLKE